MVRFVQGRKMLTADRFVFFRRNITSRDERLVQRETNEKAVAELTAFLSRYIYILKST
jgi:hypothetical protein